MFLLKKLENWVNFDNLDMIFVILSVISFLNWGSNLLEFGTNLTRKLATVFYHPLNFGTTFLRCF